jgi:hypothetical protein
MGAVAKAVKWQMLIAYAGGGYGPPVTVQIYSDPGHVLTTVDGDVARAGTNLTWADVHDGAGTVRTYGDVSFYVWISADGLPSRWAQITRMKATFNLASIPPTAIIQAVSYYFYVTNKYCGFPVTPSYALYTSRVPPWNDVVLADYQGFGNSALSNSLGYSQIVAGAFNHLDVTEANLPLFVPGQKVALAIREANFDAKNIPPTWTRYQSMYFSARCVDWITPAQRPYLQVTYQPLL